MLPNTAHVTADSMLTNKFTKAKTYLKFPSEDRLKSKQEPMERKQPAAKQAPAQGAQEKPPAKAEKAQFGLKRSYGIANNVDM